MGRMGVRGRMGLLPVVFLNAGPDAGGDEGAEEESDCVVYPLEAREDVDSVGDL